MKNNLGTFFGLSRLGVGAAFLALCAFNPVSRADVIVNNLPGNGFTSAGSSGQGTLSLGEVFTPGSDESLSSVTLSLNFSASDSASVYLYDTSSGAPTGTGTLLGSVSQSSSIINGLNNALTGGTAYAIVLGPENSPGNMSWNNTTTTGSGGTGSLGGAYSFDGVNWNQNTGINFQMEVSAVPEVPMTGVVMGFGALAIAVGGTLRRKLRPAVSSIA